MPDFLNIEQAAKKMNVPPSTMNYWRLIQTLERHLGLELGGLTLDKPKKEAKRIRKLAGS